MERLGRYRIECELGRGSMSIVYKAFDPRIDRYLAVKILKQKFARDLSCRQRFLREARAAGGLSHPNIVTVFDVGQVDGAPYIAMEMLEGDTLADRMKDPDSISLADMLDLAIQTTSALAYAHARGIIHRDIKPANIHFDRGTGVVKLMDFGIADIAGTADRRQLRQSEIAGTPAYMSPEQIQGEKVDGRCDLYSLGVVLYSLLAGKDPFQADRLTDLMARIVHEPADPLVPRDPEVPVELVELVERLIAKKPEARFQRGSQVLEELQDIRLAVNRRHADAGFWHSLAWRWPVAVAALVAVVLGGGLYLIHQQQSRAMAEVTYGFGEAMASMVAQELAEALILDDSTALSTIMSDFSSNPRVEYLHLIDREEQIRSSTDAFLEGEPRPANTGREISWGSGSLKLYQVSEDVLEFQVPVRFQARRVGEVILGLDSRDLHGVASMTMQMMGLLFLVTVLAALLGLVMLTRRLTRAVERLGWGLSKIGRGHYDFRLEERAPSELGSVFQRFNDMATRLEERYGTSQADMVDKPVQISGRLDEENDDVLSRDTLLIEEDKPEAGDRENITDLKSYHPRSKNE